MYSDQVQCNRKIINLFLGQQLRVYTDHKNLTWNNFNTARVLRRRLIIEEYGLDIQYITGDKNAVTDDMSRLP